MSRLTTAASLWAGVHTTVAVLVSLVGLRGPTPLDQPQLGPGAGDGRGAAPGV